jgi:hypothetical protein
MHDMSRHAPKASSCDRDVRGITILIPSLDGSGPGYPGSLEFVWIDSHHRVVDLDIAQVVGGHAVGS